MGKDAWPGDAQSNIPHRKRDDDTVVDDGVSYHSADLEEDLFEARSGRDYAPGFESEIYHNPSRNISAIHSRTASLSEHSDRLPEHFLPSSQSWPRTLGSARPKRSARSAPRRGRSAALERGQFKDEDLDSIGASSSSETSSRRGSIADDEMLLPPRAPVSRKVTLVSEEPGAETLREPRQPADGLSSRGFLSYSELTPRPFAISQLMRFRLEDIPPPISIVPGPKPAAYDSYSSNPPEKSNRSSDKTNSRSRHAFFVPPASSSHPSTSSKISVFRRRHFATGSEAYWLGLYFIFNLSLTLYNKSVLGRFPFPYTLTAIHAFCGTLGCYILFTKNVFVPARLDNRQNLALVGFSFLYTINIAVSNVSLQLVTIPLHQVVRGSSPLFTLLLSYMLFGTTCTFEKLLTLIPIVAGVAFATYGEYDFTSWGLSLTLLGTFLAALKGIITNVLQTRPISRTPRYGKAAPPSTLKLHPLDLLFRMSPLAFMQCVVYAWFSGEIEALWSETGVGIGAVQGSLLALNGLIAFGLNVISFTTNKKVGALTMTVAANVKQVLTILLAVFIFSLQVNSTNALGILLTLVGGAWYGIVEYNEKRATPPPEEQDSMMGQVQDTPLSGKQILP